MKFYHLMSEMTRETISRHVTLQAAVRAKIRHAKRSRKKLGDSAFIPCIIRWDGTQHVPAFQYALAESALIEAGEI